MTVRKTWNFRAQFGKGYVEVHAKLVWSTIVLVFVIWFSCPSSWLVRTRIMRVYDSGAAWSRGILQCHSQVLQWQMCCERPKPVGSCDGVLSDTLPMHVRFEGFPPGTCCWPARARASLGSWHGTCYAPFQALHPGECKYSSGISWQSAGCSNPGMGKHAIPLVWQWLGSWYHSWYHRTFYDSMMRA